MIEHPAPRKPLRWYHHVADFWHVLPDKVRRSVRTFLQGFLGVLSLQLVDAGSFGELVAADLWETAIVAGVVSLVTFIHTSVDEASFGLDSR